jgi:phosphoglycerate dehydrogenase-like enzyme
VYFGARWPYSLQYSWCGDWKANTPFSPNVIQPNLMRVSGGLIRLTMENIVNKILMTLLASVVVFAANVTARVADTVTEASPEAVQMIAQLGLREAPVASRDLPGWHVPNKVVVRYLTPAQLSQLQAAFPDINIVGVQTPKQALAEVADADVLLGFCNQALMANAKQLHWLQVYSAGVEHCVNLPRLQGGKVLVSNGQRIGSPALAEHATALMLTLMRGLDLHFAEQAKGKWKYNVGNPSTTFLELQGRTVLVVGLGGIGTQVAQRAHALGMRVIATRGSRREGPDYVDYVGLADETITLAEQADVVINTVPLTQKTTAIFNREFFKSMKPEAYFISVGRGGSTVTDDLLAALTAGEIAGAGLDVTDPEPLPAGHPLWTTPRVIITPHTAARSDRSLQRLWLLVQENLRRYVAGDPLLSVVDVDRGY